MVRKIGIGLAVIIGLTVIALVTHHWYYYKELRTIRNELNNLEGVEVIGIAGHHDITLEEIHATINIEGKGLMSIYGLKPNYQFEYKNNISLWKLGDYTFDKLSCFTGYGKGSVGFGSSLHFTSDNLYGYKFKRPILNVKDLIASYDEIKSVLDTMPHFPEWYHKETNGKEEFLAIMENSSRKHQGAFDALVRTDSFVNIQKHLPWKDSTCCCND